MNEDLIISSPTGFNFTLLDTVCKAEAEQDEAEITKSGRLHHEQVQYHTVAMRLCK